MEITIMKNKPFVAVVVVFFVLAAVIGTAAWLWQRESGTGKNGDWQLAESCRRGHGIWISAYGECQGADADWCQAAGGRSQECVSACRHSPDQNVACTAPCVSVCTLGRQFADASNQPSGSRLQSGGTVLNNTYEIEGRPIAFEGGRSTMEIEPGMAYRSTGQITAQSPPGDLDGDGFDDYGLVIVVERGEAAGLYYLAVARGSADGSYRGSNAILIGDRVSLSSVKISGNEEIAVYLTRFPWEEWGVGQLQEVNKAKRAIWRNGRLQDRPEPGGTLQDEDARKIALGLWGDCSLDLCDQMGVKGTYDGDGVWYVEAIYDGLRDDSVRVRRKTAVVRYFDGAWQPGQTVRDDWQCQPGRGHEGFGTEPCI
jgi:hypothetical protein